MWKGLKKTVRAISPGILAIALAACQGGDKVGSFMGSSPLTIGTGGGGNSSINARPMLISSLGSLNFNTTSVGETSSLTFTVLNAGTDIAIVQTPTVSIGEISVHSDSCANSGILIGEFCTMTVSFSPASAGNVIGVLNVRYLGLNGVTYQMPMSLTGTATLPQPQITSSPGSWDFGIVPTGVTASRSLIISNSSAGDAVMQAATIQGVGFSVASDACNGTSRTSSNGNCTITVEFSPSVPGSSLGLLTLHYQNVSGNASTKTVSLSGIGDLPQPTLTLSPSPHNFGDVATNTFKNHTLTVSNNTTVSTTVGTVTISGPGFTIFANNCNGILLSSGANCSITVRFTPGGLGAVTGSLSVPYTSMQGLHYTATNSLGGTGVSPTVSFAFSGFTGIPATDSTNLTATGVTLRWSAQSAAAYYVITQVGGTTIQTPHIFPTTINSYNVSGLDQNMTYEFKINAFDSGDVSDGNNSYVSVTTPSVTGATFNGWSDVVALGGVYTDVGLHDTSKGNVGSARVERNLAQVGGFDHTLVNTVSGDISISLHPFETGQKVTFHATDQVSTAPGGLVPGTDYHVIRVNSSTVQLAVSQVDAMAGIPFVPSTQGSGNFALMPHAVVKLGWELFTFTPTSTATSYNIYRGATPVSLSLHATSTTNTYRDYEVDEGSTYHYVIRPAVSGVEVTPAVLDDSVIEVFVPHRNMALVHRWIANREVCTTLLGFSWPGGINRNSNYSCNYTWGSSYAPNVPLSRKSKWDIGYSFVVDRWQSGCKMTQSGTAVPSGGSTNDVYYKQGTSVPVCYVRDAVNGWITDGGAVSPSHAQRALMRTNYPGYPPAPVAQDSAYHVCQQRAPSGVVDGNGNAGLRLFRNYELITARAVQGNRVNNRANADLVNVFNGTHMSLYGSCNILNQAFPGVTLPHPSASLPNYQRVLTFGTSLTRGCHSRYEISDLWDNVPDWTSDQLYIPVSGTSHCPLSSLDPGNTLSEGLQMDGVTGTNVRADAWVYPFSNGNTFMFPLFGMGAPATDTSTGALRIAYTLYDFTSSFMGGNNSWLAGGRLYGITGNFTSSGGRTTRLQVGLKTTTANGVDPGSNNFPGYRCLGQVGP